VTEQGFRLESFRNTFGKSLTDRMEIAEIKLYENDGYYILFIYFEYLHYI
jgi:hypothetical protein